jgi:hypothetical protein
MKKFSPPRNFSFTLGKLPTFRTGKVDKNHGGMEAKKRILFVLMTITKQTVHLLLFSEDKHASLPGRVREEQLRLSMLDVVLFQ